MLRSVLALFLVLHAATVAGQTRPSTTNRPCSSSRQMVMANGAIVLGTGGHTYDRFVRDGSFCSVAEYAYPAWVPSRDSPSCFVGYRCKSGSFWGD